MANDQKHFRKKNILTFLHPLLLLLGTAAARSHLHLLPWLSIAIDLLIACEILLGLSYVGTFAIKLLSLPAEFNQWSLTTALGVTFAWILTGFAGLLHQLNRPVLFGIFAAILVVGGITQRDENPKGFLHSWGQNSFDLGANLISLIVLAIGFSKQLFLGVFDRVDYDIYGVYHPQNFVLLKSGTLLPSYHNESWNVFPFFYSSLTSVIFQIFSNEQILSVAAVLVLITALNLFYRLNSLYISRSSSWIGSLVFSLFLTQVVFIDGCFELQKPVFFWILQLGLCYYSFFSYKRTARTSTALLFAFCTGLLLSNDPRLGFILIVPWLFIFSGQFLNPHWKKHLPALVFPVFAPMILSGLRTYLYSGTWINLALYVGFPPLMHKFFTPFPEFYGFPDKYLLFWNDDPTSRVTAVLYKFSDPKLFKYLTDLLCGHPIIPLSLFGVVFFKKLNWQVLVLFLITVCSFCFFDSAWELINISEGRRYVYDLAFVFGFAAVALSEGVCIWAEKFGILKSRAALILSFFFLVQLQGHIRAFGTFPTLTSVAQAGKSLISWLHFGYAPRMEVLHRRWDQSAMVLYIKSHLQPDEKIIVNTYGPSKYFVDRISLGLWNPLFFFIYERDSTKFFTQFEKLKINYIIVFGPEAGDLDFYGHETPWIMQPEVARKHLQLLLYDPAFNEERHTIYGGYLFRINKDEIPDSDEQKKVEAVMRRISPRNEFIPSRRAEATIELKKWISDFKLTPDMEERVSRLDRSLKKNSR